MMMIFQDKAVRLKQSVHARPRPHV